MTEEFATLPSGIQICYEPFGDPANPALLLIMGLGAPMNWWDSNFCRQLADQGHYVIRFDNRDVGRSTSLSRFGGIRNRDIVRAYLLGSKAAAPIPYTLHDMADDAVGVLDYLNIDAAHVVGVSMGGMIAQTAAIDYPDRVASLTSIMSNTGSRNAGGTSAKLFPTVFTSTPRHQDDYVKQSLWTVQKMGSPGYPEPVAETSKRAEETWQRGLNPAGSARQLMAILTQADRTRQLQQLRVPTAVIHGSADLMVRPSGGLATARSVPNAHYVQIQAMGHDMPQPLWPLFIDTISANAHRPHDT